MYFFEKVLSMKVLRHEEFQSGCEGRYRGGVYVPAEPRYMIDLRGKLLPSFSAATCNGPYGGAWSKTMVRISALERGIDESHSLCTL